MTIRYLVIHYYFLLNLRCHPVFSIIENQMTAKCLLGSSNILPNSGKSLEIIVTSFSNEIELLMIKIRYP